MKIPQHIREQPWVTYLTVTACVFVHIALAFEPNPETWKTMAKFGVLPADRIWHGAYWPLVMSAFVHIESWHLLFNIYWLWMLGRYLEHAIGSWRYLLFYIVAACVGSSYQLAFSDSTGIGASGVVYAIFGFMWIARRRYSYFYEVVNQQIVQLMTVWLVICIVATNLNLMHVANAAHVSGLAFGVVTAAALYDAEWRRRARLGTAMLLIGAVIPLFWAPWSTSWLGMKAYDAHDAGRLDEALNYYTRLLRLDPDSEWAHHNRGIIYRSLGQFDKAAEDWKKAGLDEILEEDLDGDLSDFAQQLIETLSDRPGQNPNPAAVQNDSKTESNAPPPVSPEPEDTGEQSEESP